MNVAINLYDGSYHDVDSSEIAFKIAASQAFQDAAKKAQPTLLEPIMKIEVVIPDEFLGDVNGDLLSRRGQVEGVEDRGSLKVIDAKVPLAEIFGYTTHLRSITGVVEHQQWSLLVIWRYQNLSLKKLSNDERGNYHER